MKPLHTYLVQIDPTTAQLVDPAADPRALRVDAADPDLAARRALHLASSGRHRIHVTTGAEPPTVFHCTVAHGWQTKWDPT